MITFRKNIPTFVLSLLLLISSCNIPNNSHEGTKINILSNRVDFINTSDLITEVDFIQLETSKESLIGEASKIIKTGNKYFILDSRVTKRIYIFSLEGKFLYTIGTTGKGPGEYLNPVTFCIDQNNRYLVIVDQFNKIIKTDLTGHYIKEKSLPPKARFIDDMVSYNGMLYASTSRIFMNEEKYQIIQFDDELNPVEWSLSYDTPLPFHYSYRNRFYSYKNDLYFIGVFDYKIYKKEKDQFSPFYSLNFSGKELDINTIEKNTSLFEDKSIAYLFDKCVAGESFIYLPVFIEGRPYHGFFLPEENKFTVISEIRNDSIDFIPPVTYNDGRYISSIDSYHFDEIFSTNTLDIQPSDNPVIIEYQLSFEE